MEELKKARFSAGPLTFAVRHELWDGNIQDHPDQGVAILVMADVAGKETALLRFNCFDFERSYVYGPENANLRAEGPAMLGGAATTNLYRMDSTVDGNPIGWTIRTLGTKLPRMLGRAGYSQIAELVDMAAVTPVLPDVEVAGQRRESRRHRAGVRRRRAPALRDVHGAARGREALADLADPGPKWLWAALALVGSNFLGNSWVDAEPQGLTHLKGLPARAVAPELAGRTKPSGGHRDGGGRGRATPTVRRPRCSWYQRIGRW